MKNLFNSNLKNSVFIFLMMTAGLIAGNPNITAQKCPWTMKKDMPTARLGLASAVVNDYVNQKKCSWFKRD